jgi:hypothetical protein
MRAIEGIKKDRENDDKQAAALVMCRSRSLIAPLNADRFQIMTLSKS